MHFLAVSSFLLAGFGAASGASIPERTLFARGPKGINNRGSSECHGDNVRELAEFIAAIPDTQLYDSGFHIACSSYKSRIGIGGHCAFLQGTSQPVDGRQVKALINMLNEKADVKECGSVPVSLLPEYGSVNELAKMGMLTVNFVTDTDNPCPPGVCGATAPSNEPTDLSTCPNPDPAPGKRHVARHVALVTNANFAKRGTVEGEAPRQFQKRAELDPSAPIEFLTKLTTEAGVEMAVGAIEDLEPVGGLCPLVGTFFTELVPRLSSTIGGIAGPLQGTGVMTTEQWGRYKLQALLDSTFAVSGHLSTNDLQKLIGSMAQRMARDKLSRVQVGLSTLTGAAAVTMVLTLLTE